jgi:hypothetical protein
VDTHIYSATKSDFDASSTIRDTTSTDSHTESSYMDAIPTHIDATTIPDGNAHPSNRNTPAADPNFATTTDVNTCTSHSYVTATTDTYTTAISIDPFLNYIFVFALLYL